MNNSEQQQTIQNIVKTHVDYAHKDILVEADSNKQNMLEKQPSESSFTSVMCMIIMIVLLMIIIIANIIFAI